MAFKLPILFNSCHSQNLHFNLFSIESQPGKYFGCFAKILSGHLILLEET